MSTPTIWHRRPPEGEGVFWMRPTDTNDVPGEIVVVENRSGGLVNWLTGQPLSMYPRTCWWSEVDPRKACPEIHRPVAFLDFDDVIYRRGWDGRAIEVLNGIYRRVPMMRLVVTSQWRTTRTEQELRELLLKVNVHAPMAGVTPVLEALDGESRSMTRCREIAAWITAQPVPVRTSRFVVIDDLPPPEVDTAEEGDDADLRRRVALRWVQCDMLAGGADTLAIWQLT